LKITDKSCFLSKVVEEWTRVNSRRRVSISNLDSIYRNHSIW